MTTKPPWKIIQSSRACTFANEEVFSHSSKKRRKCGYNRCHSDFEFITSRVANSVEESDSKPVTARSKDDKKIPALEPLVESTPISELRGVSMYLKKSPLSPPETTPSKPSTLPRSEREKSPTPLSKQQKGHVERVHTSAGRNMIPVFSQKELVDSGAEMLLALRNVRLTYYMWRVKLHLITRTSSSQTLAIFGL